MFNNTILKIKQIMERGLLEMRQPYLSCSWGKDSVFMLWIMRQIEPGIPVVYMDSHYAFPETYALRDRLVEEWKLNYIEIPPAVDYLDIVHEFGLPDVSRTDSDQKKVVDIIKKTRANSWGNSHGYDGNFWGIRADESKARAQMIRHRGSLFRSKEGLWRCSPLAHVKLRELWWMIDYYGVPYSSVYDNNALLPREQIRNGGWLTTDGAHHGRVAWIKKHYPDIFRKLCDINPKIRSFT